MRRLSFALALSPVMLAACTPPGDAPGASGQPGGGQASGGDMTPDTVDVVEAASATQKLDVFLQAALDAGIGERLATAREITIFAPIDPAFTAVPRLEALKADRAALRRVLERHAVVGNYPANRIPQGATELTTLSNETITLTNNGGQISVRTPGGTEAMVVQADITGDNGVVHAVNTVLVK